MTSNPSANIKLAGNEVHDLEAYIEAFESELSASGEANVEDFIPGAGHPEFHDIVVELLRVDFEHRWQRGLLNDIDGYLDRFEATLSNAKHLEPLAFEAYRCRRDR